MIQDMINSIDDATRNMIGDVILQSLPFFVGIFGALFLLASIFRWEWLYKPKKIRGVNSLLYFIFGEKVYRVFLGLMGLFMLYIVKLCFRGI